jgi:hypothetical protein
VDFSLITFEASKKKLKHSLITVMKKFTCTPIAIGFLLFLLSAVSNAQNGLENIIVEKYYISDAADSIAADGISANPGTLPVGSTTYRIYVDMLPGYKFQAAYGVPDHEMRIETSSLFYNNEDRGATTPSYSKNNAKNNTVMLDSWLTVGAGCAGNFGVLKTADDGLATVVNADGVLQNNDANAGIPLTTEDGLLAGAPEPVTTVGIDVEIAMFDAQNDGTNGPLFSTWNGSLACLNGAVGLDTSTNQVLIAQMTTNGTFCFELNIQIGKPNGDVENYVARNPVGNEIVIPSLIYCSMVGIKDPQTSSSTSFLHVYPNPASDAINVQLDGIDGNDPADYKIYDMTGRIVTSGTIETITGHSQHIDITSLEHGIYFIEVSSGTFSGTQKFSKN